MALAMRGATVEQREGGECAGDQGEEELDGDLAGRFLGPAAAVGPYFEGQTLEAGPSGAPYRSEASSAATSGRTASPARDGRSARASPSRRPSVASSHARRSSAAEGPGRPPGHVAHGQVHGEARTDGQHQEVDDVGQVGGQRRQPPPLAAPGLDAGQRPRHQPGRDRGGRQHREGRRGR